MKKAIILGLLLLIVGLIIGYLVFGKVGKRYIPIKRLLGISDTVFDDFLNTITEPFLNPQSIRNRILLCGAGGLLLGIVLGFLVKERR